jgi:phosphatidylglycerophosphatase A
MPAFAMTRRIPRLIAAGFGCGDAPVAPGTVASLAAVVLGAALLKLSPWALAAAAAVATLGGVWAIGSAGVGAADPGWVVIDEVAGQWITLLALPAPSWRGLAAAFLLFRLLDIAKPPPISWADRRSGPVAVMADDVIAGAIGVAVLLLARLFWPGLLD